MKPRVLMRILWPAFLAAAIAVTVVFTLIDPGELDVLGKPLQASRLGVYTVGFLLAWAVCAVSSALTVLMLPRGRAEDDEDELP
ncbi:hypothetical protein [Paracidovorax citrulli]